MTPDEIRALICHHASTLRQQCSPDSEAEAHAKMLETCERIKDLIRKLYAGEKT